MIKKIKQALLTLAAFSLFAVPAVMPASVFAADAITGGLNCGAELDVSSVDNPTCTVDGTAASTKVNDIIKLVINIFSLIVGVIAVIMIVIGGLKYITSGGDSGNVTGAKNTILYAVVGLVVVALAQIVVRFVLTKVNGTTAP